MGLLATGFTFSHWAATVTISVVKPIHSVLYIFNLGGDGSVFLVVVRLGRRILALPRHKLQPFERVMRCHDTESGHDVTVMPTFWRCHL